MPGTLHAYVCDFPTNALKDHPRVVTLPHLGASTNEAEENCAVMVADTAARFPRERQHPQLGEFPEAVLPRVAGTTRIAIANSNVPNMVGQISTCLAGAGAEHRRPAQQVARRVRLHARSMSTARSTPTR